MNATPSPLIDRAAWLDERRKGIGASEAAAALGLDPFTSPLKLYARKLGLEPDEPPSIRMRCGLAKEDLIAELYEEETGRVIPTRQQFVRHPEHGWLFATLDGITNDDTIVEFKTTSDPYAKALGEPGTDQVHDHWLIQAHVQMACFNGDSVDFAVLIGDHKFCRYTVEWSETVWSAIFPKIEAFWRRVQDEEPPPAVAPPDARVLLALYPVAEGEVSLSAEDAAVVDRWEALKAECTRLDIEAKTLKTKLLDRMADRGVGLLPDGRLLKRKVVNVAARTQTVAAYSFADLRVSEGGRS